jgi:NAD(P)H dehydrogenase (quinone)
VVRVESEVIAVTGAGGRIGGLVAHRLGQAGVAFRPIARDVAKVPAFPGAEPAVAATYDDQSAMEAALAGATTLFLVSGRETADRLHQHKTAVNSAVAAGVRRVVYLSFLGASPQATFTLARQHWYTEEHMRASGLACTFLRDSLYMASFPLWTGSDGVIRGPAGNGVAGHPPRTLAEYLREHPEEYAHLGGPAPD